MLDRVAPRHCSLCGKPGRAVPAGYGVPRTLSARPVGRLETNMPGKPRPRRLASLNARRDRLRHAGCRPMKLKHRTVLRCRRRGEKAAADWRLSACFAHRTAAFPADHRRLPAYYDQAPAVPPAGDTRWILRLLACELDARGRDRDQLRNRAPHAKKRANILESDPALLSARERGGVGDDGGGAGSLRPAVRCGTNAPSNCWPQRGRRGPATYDYEYVRRGTCAVWLFVEPLSRWRSTLPLSARRWIGRAKGRP